MTDDHGTALDGAELGWQLSTAVVLFHEAVARRMGLSAADHKALGVVNRAGGLTAGELAEAVGLSPGAATGLIDRLEAAGYVRRTRDPDDRRRVVVVPVRENAPDLSPLFAGLSAAMTEMVARYDLDEQAVIHDYVVNTIAVLREQTRRIAEPTRTGAPPVDADRF